MMQRNQVFADQHDRKDRKHEHGQSRAIHARHARQKRGGHDGQRADEQPCRDEEAPRIFQVASQHIVSVGALGVNAER